MVGTESQLIVGMKVGHGLSSDAKWPSLCAPKRVGMWCARGVRCGSGFWPMLDLTVRQWNGRM
ncbi:hypothetical protein [Fervidibacter sacchari]